jgi:hypothetical protein
MRPILIIAFNNLTHDGRVLRQIDFVKGSYQTTVVCYNAPAIPGVEIVVVKPGKLTLIRKAVLAACLLLRFYKLAYRLQYGDTETESTLRKRSFDLVIANDAETLPLAFMLKGKGKVLFDAHEFAPRQFEEKLWWRIFYQGFNEYLCDAYLARIDGMMTIGTALANAYKTEYPVDPEIITNANFFHPNIQPSKVGNPIRIIHHGGATPSRRLELLIEMMQHLGPGFTLDLMLLTPSTANKSTRNYLEMLKTLGAGNPDIRFIPPKKPFEISEFISNYDIGIILVPPVNYNYENGLPNKLFDFVQARLALAVGPLSDIANVVRSHNMGVVSDDFTAANMASKLKELSIETLQMFKHNAGIAASKMNADQNKVILNNLIRKILS